MAEKLEAENCKRCGKVILKGEIDLIPVALDLEELPGEHADVLSKYMLVAQLRIKVYGQIRSVMGRWYWPDDSGDWIPVTTHRCYREELHDYFYQGGAATDAARQSEIGLNSPVSAIRGECSVADSDGPPF